MGNCENYDSCIQKRRDDLKHPIDARSLYAKRIYDNQTANRLCYNENPVEIIEGFGGGFTLNNLLRWAIIIVVIYLITMVAMKLLGNKTFKLNLGNMDGGSTSYSLANLSFLNTSE